MKLDKAARIALIFLAVTLAFTAVMGIKVALGSRGAFNHNKYDAQVRAALESPPGEAGTRIAPFNEKKEVYVFDVEYDGKRLIPLGLVAQEAEQLGGILRYTFEEDIRGARDYTDSSGKRYKGYPQRLHLTLTDLEGAELTSRTFFSRLPQTATARYHSFTQPFSDEDRKEILEWIEAAMEEHLGYKE